MEVVKFMHMKDLLTENIWNEHFKYLSRVHEINTMN